MENLRALRHRRSLTFLDLAALTGIPARRLAEIEYGLQRLSAGERDSLALVLGLSPHDFTGAHRRLPAAATRPAGGIALALPAPAERQAAQALLAAALAAALAAGSLGAVFEDLPTLAIPSRSAADLVALSTAPAPTAPPATAAAIAHSLETLTVDPARDDAALIRRRALVTLAKRAALLDEALTPLLVAGPTPDEALAPAPLPAIEPVPAFVLSEQGPIGCPVQPAAGRVVITQGYGVGTHAPATIWGAVDLAVDGDGDGYAEIGPSWYAPIVATHDGHVTVDLDTYPAGNHVWIDEPGGIWRTGYSHLAIVTVIGGQFVRAGEQIGVLGSTGKSSGPHLDYQVWRSGVNIDPTWLVGCH